MLEEDIRETDPDTFEDCESLYGPFDMDAACTLENAKAIIAYTLEGKFIQTGTEEWVSLDKGGDTFEHDWSEKVWLNPPFSELRSGRWHQRCWEQILNCKSITMIVPSTRTEQRWWQEWVEPFRDGKEELVEGVTLTTTCLPKRRRFLIDGKPILNKDGTVGSARFGITIIHWENTNEG